jgi:CheY-like chemotaxis protein/nitrogen-specific signal transduction histidine kinase
MNYNASLLVVDDLEGMRRLLGNSLRQLGFSDVHTAMHGADALNALGKRRFDAVLTDWNMPVMNGLELLRQIRANDRFGSIPVIMVTVETDREQVRSAFEAGVSEYLVKPFNLAALETKLRRAFHQPLTHAHNIHGNVSALLPGTIAKSGAGPLIVSAPDETGGTRRATILAVDDVADNLNILMDMLGQDYQMRVANSGARALKIIQSGKIPDLILLDVMMPDMDGFEVCRYIKSNPATAEVPIIFLTAMGQTTDVTKGFSLGAADYVSKPADPSILKARMETHLRLQRSIAELKRNRIELIEKNAVLEDNLRLREDVERISRHDLRNPLAGIIGFTANLLSDDTVQQPHKDLLYDIEQSAYNVLNMVNLSLDLYKMERGEFDFYPRRVNVGSIVERILLEMAVRWDHHQIKLERKIQGVPVDSLSGAVCMGDDLLCYSLFSNLLRNAADAASPNSSIVLHVSQLADLVISVHNSGAVPIALRDTFFDKYATAAKSGGNGLGTYSARLLAITQGGNITMETSDVSDSTTITVHLPLPPAMPLTSPAKH